MDVTVERLNLVSGNPKLINWENISAVYPSLGSFTVSFYMFLDGTKRTQLKVLEIEDAQIGNGGRSFKELFRNVDELNGKYNFNSLPSEEWRYLIMTPWNVMNEKEKEYARKLLDIFRELRQLGFSYDELTK